MKLQLRQAAIYLVAMALGASAGLSSAQTRAAPRSAAAPASVHGLIVQLRDAPSHAMLAREQALASGNTTAARETARWQRLVADWRADGTVLRELPAWAAESPRRDPVGASAQVLRFARPLTPEQAARVAARLAARPDVAWVEPNLREQRQQAVSNPPNDPYFPGLQRQWWLQQVQGSDLSPIDGRLRGVPGFLPTWLNRNAGSAAAVVAVLDSGITCHPDLGNVAAGCVGGVILPGYDFVADWDPVKGVGYANDGDGRDSDPRDPGDWVGAGDKTADPVRYSSCEVENSSWHGTVIAAMVAARTDNGIGVAAMNWQGRVVPVRVSGKCGADVSDIVDGMRWAAGLPTCKRSNGTGGCVEFAPVNANPARIINISFGGDAACGTAYQQAVNDVGAAVFPGGAVGAVVVAAAGNHWGAPSRPANCTGVIGVGALNRDGFKTNYSNFGAALTVSTVGGDDNDGAWGPRLADSGLLTLGNPGTTTPANCAQFGVNCYFSHFGTSFSAPIVAGAVSLMLSQNPALTVAQIEQGLRLSARPHVTSNIAGFGQCSDSNPGRCLCTPHTCGAGILDAEQALIYAQAPTGYVRPTWPLVSLDNIPELQAAVAGGPDRPSNTPTTPAPTPSGGGGGAFSLLWLMGLGLATLWLSRPLSAGSLRQAGRKARSPQPSATPLSARSCSASAGVARSARSRISPAAGLSCVTRAVRTPRWLSTARAVSAAARLA